MTDWQALKQKITNKGLWGANRANTEISLRFLEDLEIGLNTGKNKGNRTGARLITVARRMSGLAYFVESCYGANKRFTDLTERELLILFKGLREGRVTGKRGTIKDVATYAKCFKQFWEWYLRVERKSGRNIYDITEDLSTTNDYKPGWVYLTETQIKELADHCRYDYKTLIWFVIDSGVRPQELSKLLVGDVQKDEKGTTWLNIRQDIAKKNSFGRRIKLLVCAEMLDNHIRRNHLDHQGNPKTANKLFTLEKETIKKYLRRRAIKLFGEHSVSPARDQYKNISLYDLRHNAAVYWQNRYRSVNSLLYRFGWRDPTRLHYYSEAIGHQDQLQEEHLLVDVTATQLEKQLAQEKQKREMIEEQLADIQKRLELIGLWKQYEQMPHNQTNLQAAPSGNRDKLSKHSAFNQYDSDRKRH